MAKKSDPVCIFCGAPSTLLCDGHLGYPPAAPSQMHREYEGLDLFRPFTCDAPMCTNCAISGGHYFFCRRGKGCIQESVDYCPGCNETKEALRNNKPNRRRIENEKHAAIIRAAHWREHAKGRYLIAEDGGGQMPLL